MTYTNILFFMLPHISIFFFFLKPKVVFKSETISLNYPKLFKDHSDKIDF